MKRILGLFLLMFSLVSCSIGQGLKDDEINTRWLSPEWKSAMIEKKTGNAIITTNQFEYFCDSYHEGLCYVRKGWLFGFIDTHWKLVIPYQFDSASDFHEGLAEISKDNTSGKGYIEWFIDTDGDMAFTYDRKTYFPLGSFTGGMLFVRNSAGQFGAVDKKWKIVIPIEYMTRSLDDFTRKGVVDGKVEIYTGSTSWNTFQTGSLDLDGTVKWNEKKK